MTGGPPIFVSPPQYVQPRPAPAPQQWPPRAAQQALPPGANAPGSPVPATARAKPYEEKPEPSIQSRTAAPKLEPLTLPSPESLGLAPKSAPAKVDWNATLERLDRLGRIGHQVVQLDDGRCRVLLVMRTRQADQVQRIEATAATEAEAVGLALARAEQWVATGR